MAAPLFLYLRGQLLCGAIVETAKRSNRLVSKHAVTSVTLLGTMEDFICAGANKSVVFPDQGLLLAYDRVIAATHREFLNANIHYPGNINVTADSLEAIAAGGMFSVIQGIINLL